MSLSATISAYAALAVVSTGVVWKGSEWLESSSEKLSAHYELPPLVQGAVVLAVGSSFPELSTAVLATLLHGEFELGVAAITGSALFNVLMIPALARLGAEEDLSSTRDLVYKEIQFYLLSIAALLLSFAFAVIYNPVGDAGGPVTGELTRGIALFPFALYLFYVYLQYQDTQDHEPETAPERVSAPKQFGILAGGLTIILVGVEGLVRSAIGFGSVLGTPSFLWGVTVVAVGTSVPDTFVSVRAAREGKAIASVANVLGSNVFDLLVCIPAGVLVAGTAVVNFSVGAPMMGVLTLATLIVFLVMRSHMNLTTAEAWGLIVIYLIFVLWMGVETFGAVDLLPNLPPAGSGPGS
ncbi:MAG: sodium:calcium antiporter [Salinibacter sp.]|uniref:sodium:calcium antiporter n=1 Tax=Salinibacter sp. TaxID=2065818 RepID=UPI002FC3456E